jgi:DNA polymerase III alpha subunit
MEIDEYGNAHRTTDELCALLYTNPDINLHDIQVDDPDTFNQAVRELFYDIAPLNKYRHPMVPLEDFDAHNQSQWIMPQKYKDFDISKWLLEQCQNEEELQRVAKELLMYQDRNLIVLLQFMKYFVDTMRKHNVVWGVGRGSSVSSYVLFLIGVHKINSLYFDLDIEEFIK